MLLDIRSLILHLNFWVFKGARMAFLLSGAELSLWMLFPGNMFSKVIFGSKLSSFHVLNIALVSLLAFYKLLPLQAYKLLWWVGYVILHSFWSCGDRYNCPIKIVKDLTTQNPQCVHNEQVIYWPIIVNFFVQALPGAGRATFASSLLCLYVRNFVHIIIVKEKLVKLLLQLLYLFIQKK